MFKLFPPSDGGLTTHAARALPRPAAHPSSEDCRPQIGTIVEAFPEAVVLKSADGRWWSANSAARALLGLDDTDWQGRLNDEIATQRPDLARTGIASRDEDERAWSAGAALDGHATFVTPSGERRRWHVRRVPVFERRRRDLLILICSDVTEHHRRIEQSRLAATAFHTHEAIVITDVEGTILRVNRAFTDITGYTEDEALGRNPRMLKSGRHGEAFYEHMWRALTEEGMWEGEIWNRRKSGEHYPAWETITAVRDESGEVTHYVAVQGDISRVKSFESIVARSAAEEHALGGLLKLSLEQLSTREYLDRAVALLLESVPWLELLPSGGVFLREGEILRLVAGRHLSPVLQERCARVEPGQCLCGRAAATGEVQYAGCVDERHTTSFPGMEPHGHYTVPITLRGEVLGVLVLYLPEGHRRDVAEIAFLQRVADVLSMGITQRQVTERQVERLAYYDPLTGLPNRRLFLDRLERSITRAARHSRHGALLFIDLDRFKPLNDARGHSYGDRLLEQVAQRLLGELRSEDTVARLASDEFAVLLPELGSDVAAASVHARRVADKLRLLLQGNYDLGRYEYHLTASIGVALFPHAGQDAQTVLSQADAAMYRAKLAGRNAISFYSRRMQREADSRLQLEQKLRHAVARDELELHYQAQVDEAGAIVGAEALLRWFPPGQRPVSPGRFIPIAEDSDLILTLGDWALRRACAQLHAWSGSGAGGRGLPRLSVNISVRQFHEQGFVDFVSNLLEESEVEPARLTLEITEGVAMEDVGDTVRKMKALRELGVRFALDDFGTGYSSLAYLKRLPLHELKIDRSFVRELTEESDDLVLVETIIAMADRLGLEVVAEGVETLDQMKLLAARGCHIYQGYCFSQPAPGPTFEAQWLGSASEQERDRVAV